MNSLWAETAELPKQEALNGDLHTDVLVIGGGIAGILSAWRLQQAGLSCAVVEAETIGGKTTGNTTAKLTVQHGLQYSQLMKQFGREKAMQYLQANASALEEYRKLCQSIDCDFAEKDSYVYSCSDKEGLEAELAALEQLGYPGQWCTELPLPFSVVGAVQLHNQAQFHPLKFLAALSRDLRIFEHTPILQLQGMRAVTAHGSITAEKILVATHFPIFNQHGSYFIKLYQHRSYVLALKNAPDLNGMYVDEAQSGLSFRNAQGLLLLGGGSHRTGHAGGNWAELEAFAKAAYPDAVPAYRWAAQDCMTLDGVPYIGQYSASTPNLFVATGFNKWGMTSAMAASAIVRDLILEKENPYAPVFSPSRSILHPQLARNAWETTINLLTPTRPRCPHLGCALKWNPQEHSWDCPCHGSRFEENGKLLENPATGNLPIQNKKK